MKVCYVTMAFPTATETFASDEILQLEELGVDVRVHCLRPAFSYAKRLTSERGVGRITITHGSAVNQIRGMLIGFVRPWLCLRLLAFIVVSNRFQVKGLLLSLIWVPRSLDIVTRVERENPDVVHLYWGHFPSIVGFLVQQRLPNVIVTISLRAYDLDMRFPCTAPVARKAAFVRTIAAANIPAIRQMGVSTDRIELCYSGIDLQKLRPVDEVPHRIIVAARLIPEKRVDDVLTVTAAIHAKWPTTTLHVLGDGPQAGSLRVRATKLGIEHSVRFLGHLPHERVFAEMAASKVLLFLTQFGGERLPNVIKEAMASQCACVVTRTPGIEELIEDGKSGYIVAPGDLASAQSRIESLFADPDLSDDLAAAARQTIAERFDFRKCTKRLLDLWEEALNRHERDASERAVA